MFRYGPFHLSVSLNALDAQVINYVFSEDLPPSETIVSTARIIVNRSSVRTLEPKVWIISLVADNNKHIATKKISHLYWYMPTQFAIYIPINNLKNHWYLTLVNIKESKVEIWDSLPSRRKNDQSRLKQVQKFMISLDNVLATEMKSCFGSSFSFQRFSLVWPKDVPTQLNFYDSGVFVCMFMNEQSNATSRKFTNTINSVAERLFFGPSTGNIFNE
ncbi:hypothetical protein Ddye_015249 [Dipteronia dyeriana]|uniref:Ubiquitin-like protease family profile domain-containing protein n=1 Tax=Dipteronia dyeriana TaxID=168575 RepID=A0AAD9WZD4_9ROSI|nr:hypothetical protein Ddye_015249 [Dipteronia dyeriana]